MDHFQYRGNILHAEDIPVADIAKAHGTPCYIYSKATLSRHFQAFDQAFGDHAHLICYSVKANSNLAVLNLLAKLGSGFDIVSLGELKRVLAAGASADKIVFSGVGKREDEIEEALRQGIACFNVESEQELFRINEIAGKMDKIAPVSLRVNPDVDANTHPYISTGLKENKFGIDIDKAFDVYKEAKIMPYVHIEGIDCHIGSQLTEISPFLDALDRVLELVDKLAKVDIKIRHLDLGGGLGVVYKDETPPSPQDYVQALLTRLGDRTLCIHLEPGRAIAANAGILVTQVEYLKHNEAKNFLIVDAAMTELLRPSLYQSWQQIQPVVKNDGPTREYDVVGPVCETGDFLGKSRQLNVQQGDLLAVRSSGAYGFVMSSNYNSRPRPPEVMVDGNQSFLIRQRETEENLYAGEMLLP